MDSKQKPTLLNKKQVDLTVKDGLKVDVVTAVAQTVVPVAIGAVFAGASLTWKKFQERRNAKSTTETTEGQ